MQLQPNDNLKTLIQTMGRQAQRAAAQFTGVTPEQQDLILTAMATALLDAKAEILAANALDIADGRQQNLSAAMLDRLQLNEQRLTNIAEGMLSIAKLPNPLGKTITETTRPNGLKISKVRVPIGVIAVIYESRPNVTADVAALCCKTGNAVILRGGRESLRSGIAIVKAMRQAGESAGLPPNAIQLVETTDRAAVREIVQLSDYVDLVIPRGGEALIRTVTEQAHVPVIKHYQGICHIYADASADIEKTLNIVENAKCQRPAVCNAVETLLVNEKIAAELLPRLIPHLQAKGVEIRGDQATQKIMPTVKAAQEEDWRTEYLDLILAVRIVPDTKTAIDHINQYGSRHSDAILTNDQNAARQFTREVDSAAVYVNASTRFTDGGEFGMGAEIGISTDKLHARGPMGLEELTTYKYVVLGNGQIRS